MLWFIASVVGMVYVSRSAELFIDENDLDSYAEPIADNSSRMIGYFISIPFMIAGIITLVLSFV